MLKVNLRNEANLMVCGLFAVAWRGFRTPRQGVAGVLAVRGELVTRTLTEPDLQNEAMDQGLYPKGRL